MKTPRTTRRDAPATNEISGSQTQAAIERAPRTRKAAPAVPADKAEPFGPITTRRISEEISARIRQQIASGALPPGTRLPTERELSEQFAVSRMAVREGMRTLEVAGLIIMKKGRHGGAFVNESSAKLVTQQIRDMIDLGRASLPMLMEARLMVMDMVVRLACERATAADFRAMEANLEKTQMLTEAGRFEERTFTAIEFNKLLADATRNDILGALVEGLSEVLRHFIVVTGPQPIDSVVPTRRKLIDQIRARDSNGAAVTMGQYLEDIHSYLIRQSRNTAARKSRASS
ncbi:FadR/GntR family transcriptional regulator [Paraburkholderia lacunae]|uniref:FadR family transcriptional regulator n=1 Tax=Paraburkholderia lacunae TaxID=2211104 RepID=A0A370MVF0_9BURK|nr:GntR family transcriptional regulator [Paraburkholderia lacunae]RDJ97361.1 FadR family transcriptional regulator [Paraburkholderia lacunae]